ncbi:MULTISPECIES: hypothetical protein [Vibrio]|uniref:hypothetical protein n=1 Tax=Vibrio TaxID=662 RepID=UPI001559976E|nr:MULTISPECIES: hypothetical protein [Vibrio]MDW1954947.1 hypothetical protein [Vibrio sp. Vb0562]MDW1996242.1 hypothetical protein [Vibrio sp. 299]
MYPKIEKFLLKSEPDKKFLCLEKEFNEALQAKFISKDLFMRICRWKSKRKTSLQKLNSEERINDVMSSVFRSSKDSERINLLCSLDGVAVPTASTFLTMLDSSRYGVVDLHAWRVLHRMGIVRGKSSGKSLNTSNYITYLNQIRTIATHFDVTPRLVDISLMKENQRVERRFSSSCA